MSVINQDETIFQCDKCKTKLEVLNKQFRKIPVYIVDTYQNPITTNKDGSNNHRLISSNHYCELCWNLHKEKDNFLNKKGIAITLMYQHHNSSAFNQEGIQATEFEYKLWSDENNPGNNNPNQPSNGNPNSFNWTPLLITGLVLAVMGIGVWYFIKKHKNKDLK